MSTPSSCHQSLLRSILLILLSFTLIFVAPLLLLSSYGLSFFSSETTFRNRARRNTSFRPRTILVSGVGTTQGLFLARCFYLAGHNVIGADFELYGLPVCSGRWTKSVSRFYTLGRPPQGKGDGREALEGYNDKLLRIVLREKVQLWVSCSDCTNPVEDARASEILGRRSACSFLQFDPTTTRTLCEKDTFLQQTRRLGLPVPETHHVTSRAAVHKVLHESPRTKKRYIMHPTIPIAEAPSSKSKRPKTSQGNDEEAVTALPLPLPRRTESETYEHISRLPISPSKPWVLQQYIPHSQSYHSYSLIIDNAVRAFVAYSANSGAYEPLPPTSALSKSMLRFTQEFAKRSGETCKTGHLIFEFAVEEAVNERGAEMVLLPLSCTPQLSSPAVVLLAGQGSAIASAYLATSATADRVGDAMAGTEEIIINWNGHGIPDGITGFANGEEKHEITTPLPHQPKLYNLPPTLSTLLFHPLLDLFSFRPQSTTTTTITTLVANLRILATLLLLDKEASSEMWDPVPAWWLWCVWSPLVWLTDGLWRIGGGQMR